MSTLETNHDVRLLGQPVDDLAFPLVPPLGPNHDHIGHEAAFLRVGGARDNIEATKAFPAIRTPIRGSYAPGELTRPRRSSPSAAQLPDFAGLMHPLPAPTLSPPNEFAPSKSLCRQHRRGEDFGPPSAAAPDRA